QLRIFRVLKSRLDTVGRFVRSGLSIAAVVLVVGGVTHARERVETSTSSQVAPVNVRPAVWSGSTVGGINAQVFSLALNAASCAVHAGAVANPSTLTIIDYSKPSTEK